MTMKSILVPMEMHDAVPSVLTTAQLMAEKFASHIEGVAVRPNYAGFIAGSGNDGYRANVRSAIKRIRNKFRELDPTFEAIENYTASGYCWGRPDVVG